MASRPPGWIRPLAQGTSRLELRLIGDWYSVCVARSVCIQVCSSTNSDAAITEATERLENRQLYGRWPGRWGRRGDSVDSPAPNLFATSATFWTTVASSLATWSARMALASGRSCPPQSDPSQRVQTSNGSESPGTRSPPSWLLPLGATKFESESCAVFRAEITVAVRPMCAGWETPRKVTR
jgi:hypothetical protein